MSGALSLLRVLDVSRVLAPADALMACLANQTMNLRGWRQRGLPEVWLIPNF